MAACSTQQEAPAYIEQSPAACPANVSTLTGLAFADSENAAANTRPVAIAVDNVRAALPQRGLSQAGIIYEALYAGGVTHLLAVFDDYAKLPETGPVTVMDSQLTQLALPLDAMCLSTSATAEAQALTEKYNRGDMTVNASFETGALALDSDRNSITDISRCWFTNGTLFSMAVKQYSLDAETSDSARMPAFNFVNAADAPRELAEKAGHLEIRFSGYTTCSFDYSGVNKKYYKRQFDERQIDENTAKSLVFDNVIVLFGNILTHEGEAALFDFDAGGEGYYFYGGGGEAITWHKDSADSAILFENSDGAALINRGTTYVALADVDKREHFVMSAR